MNVNFYSQSSERLKQERIRLGLSQAQAGDLCGVSREMWGKYERAAAVPGGEVLFSFAAAGADVNYILTGVRVPAVVDKQVEAAIKLFEGMDKKQRDAALQAITNQERLKPVERLRMTA